MSGFIFHVWSSGVVFKFVIMVYISGFRCWVLDFKSYISGFEISGFRIQVL